MYQKYSREYRFAISNIFFSLLSKLFNYFKQNPKKRNDEEKNK